MISIREIIESLPAGTRFLITPDALVIEGPEWTRVERSPGMAHVIEEADRIRAACAEASARITGA